MTGIAIMKGLAYKKVSWLSSVKRISYAKKSPANSLRVMSENVALLDGRLQKRCCCGLFRVNGSDGAWAWLVAFANFLVNFIIVGLGRMSGILYVDFMDMFHIDRKTASIPFSIQQAGRNLFGPVAGILGQKYGLRTVTIFGGIIGSLSAVIAYFKMDITSITILWGLLFGISTALTTTLNQVSIDQYFEKHRATAGGFAFSGGCVGAFFFPFVLETLIAHYGMKGTFLVMGAIILNVIPAAMMLVEPPWKQNKSGGNAYEKNITQYGSLKVEKLLHSVSVVPKGKSNKKLTGTGKKLPSTGGIDFGYLQANSDIVLQFLTMEISDKNIQTIVNENDLQNFNKMRLLNELECVYSIISCQEENLQNRISSVLQDCSLKRNESGSKFESESSDGSMSKKETIPSHFVQKEYDNEPRRIFIESKLQEIYETRGTKMISHFHYPDQARACKILIELRKLYEKLVEDTNFQTIYSKTQRSASTLTEDADELEIKQDAKTHSNSFCSHIKTAVKLHGNPLFLLICLCRGVFMLTFIPVVTIIVDFAMDKGLNKSDGKYVIAALSLGDFLGRLGLGWVTDRGCLSLPRYMFVAMIILGVSTATLPLMHCKLHLLGAVLFFAILQGSLFVRHPILVSQYMKSHEKSIGMGFINFLSGFLGFALPAFIGYFRDVLGSYDKMFYVNGIICAVVGLLWLLEPLFIRVSTQTQNLKSSEKK